MGIFGTLNAVALLFSIKRLLFIIRCCIDNEVFFMFLCSSLWKGLQTAFFCLLMKSILLECVRLTEVEV